MTDYSPIIYWVKAREAIRIKKEAGEPFPWTDDPILRDFRFCNVRREDDTVTKWIAENIRKPHADHPHLWLMLCIARTINWPPTLQRLIDEGGWPTHPDFLPQMRKTLDRIHGKVYTGAYIIPPSAIPGVGKNEYIVEEVIGGLWRHRTTFDPMTLQGTHLWLMRHQGWGQFMAYQAVVDMRFTAILGSASDANTWAAAGPGTLRGLNRIQGLSAKHRKLSQSEALNEMYRVYNEVSAIPIKIDFSDVPNILCEVDKYLRVQNDEGRPRATYVPGRGA